MNHPRAQFVVFVCVMVFFLAFSPLRAEAGFGDALKSVFSFFLELPAKLASFIVPKYEERNVTPPPLLPSPTITITRREIVKEPQIIYETKKEVVREIIQVPSPPPSSDTPSFTRALGALRDDLFAFVNEKIRLTNPSHVSPSPPVSAFPLPGNLRVPPVGYVPATDTDITFNRPVKTGSNGSITLINSDGKIPDVTSSYFASPPNIFSSIANASQTIQFSATSTSDLLSFAGSGGTTISFDQATKKITVTSSGSSGTITLADVLTNGSDASSFTGTTRIGGATLTSGGNATFAGTLTVSGTATSTFAGPLQIANTISNASGNITLSPASNFIISNGNVGIGTASPTEKVHVVNDNDAAIRLESYAGEAQLRGYRATGSQASPSAVTSSKRLLNLGGFGYDGATFAESARFAALTEEAWTTTARGAYWIFETTAPGTTSRSEKMRITGSGNVGIGDATPDSLLEVSASAGASDLFMLSSNDADDGNRFIVKNSGSVGIGTTSPSALLHVTASSTNTLLVNNTGTSNGTTPIADFQNSGTSRMFIATNGNVGIGTSSPNISAGSGNVLTLQSTSGAIIEQSRNSDSLTDGQAVGQFLFYAGTANTEIARIRANVEGTSENAGDLEFITATGGIASSRMTILSSGNVGIGTAAPNYKLEVSGKIAAIGNNIVTDSRYEVGSVGTLVTPSIFKTGDVDTGIWFPIADNLGLVTGGVDRLRIDATGNVGIGTTSPSALLELDSETSTSTVSMFEVTSDFSSNENIVFKILSNGDFSYDGTGSSPASDVAELYESEETLEPGDLVMLDASSPHSTAVKKASSIEEGVLLGAVSTKPALLFGATADQSKSYPIALAGRIPVKVSTENGAIRKGDRITASSLPGVGAKAAKAGQTIGIALEPFEGEGAGIIPVFITLEYIGNDLSLNTSSGDLTLKTETLMDQKGNELFLVEDGSTVIPRLVVKDFQIAKDGTLTLPRGKGQIVGDIRIEGGEDSKTILHPLVHYESRIFLTLRESIAPQGMNWSIVEQKEGEFTIRLSMPALYPLSFSYWIIQTSAVEESQEEEPLGAPTAVIEKKEQGETIENPKLDTDLPDKNASSTNASS